MSASSSTRVRAVGLLCLVALLVAFTVSLSACGDPYSGDWKGDVMGEEIKIKIEKSGDKWLVSSPDDQASEPEKVEATEEDGKLVAKDPEDANVVVTFEAKDDKLVMGMGGATIELEKQ